MSVRAFLESQTWFGAEPATEQEISRLASDFSDRLPQEYADFLRWSNGGETQLPGSYVVLWSVDEVERLGTLYEVPKTLPGALAIGTDGGPNLVAYLAPAESSIVGVVPFDDFCREAVTEWPSLIALIGHWAKAGPEAESMSWGDRADVYLLAAPPNGMADVARLRSVLGLEMGLAELKRATGSLPALLQSDVHYGRTKELLAKCAWATSTLVGLVPHRKSPP